MKGIAIVLADGISSSNVSQIASESAVKSFLTDYYCTSESWSVKTSAQRVLAATNSWLNAQTRRSQFLYEKDKGYVCTLSAMVIKSTTAHLFHVGDSRIYRLAGQALEQLTEDHRVIVSSEQNYLSRALGINPQLEIDHRTLAARKRRCLPAGHRRRLRTCREPLYRRTRSATTATTSTGAARIIVEQAYQHGSPDNLTIQIVRIDELPDSAASEVFGQASELPPPPLLEAQDDFRRLPDRPGGSRQQPEPHLSGGRHRKRRAGHHQDSIDRPARRPGLPQALHDGRVGRPPHRQPAMC